MKHARDRDVDSEVRTLRAELERSEAQRDALEAELHQVHTSTMWRSWNLYWSVRRGLGMLFGTIGRGVAALFGGLAAAWSWIVTVVGRSVVLCYHAGRCGLEWSRWLLRPALRRAEIPQPAAVASASSRRPRLLIVFPYYVYPEIHGGARRVSNQIRHLAKEFDLYLLLFIGGTDDPRQRDVLEDLTRGIFFYKWPRRLAPDRFRADPPASRLFEDPLLAERIEALVTAHEIDIVQLDYTELGQYWSACDGAQTALVEHDIGFRGAARRRRIGLHDRFQEGQVYGATRGDVLRLMTHELATLRKADQIHVMSEDDGQYIAPFLKDGVERIRIVRNGVDTTTFCPDPNGARNDRALFVGSFSHLPNRDALEFLVGDIWPRIRRSMPDAQVTIVGSNPPDEVLALDGLDGVSIVGEVEDVVPYYQSHRVMLAPLRAGSGTRLKIVEAMACEIPVVSTTLGAEGIRFGAQDGLVIADDASAYADAVVALLQGSDEAAEIGRRGRVVAREHYDWESICRLQVDGYRELLNGREPRATILEQESPAADISIVIPTLNGGEGLGRCLDAIEGQVIDRSFDVLCVDSGSDEESLRIMRRPGVRIHSIDRRDFDHGATRDLGARITQGEVIVFLNQDAVPVNESWLRRLTESLWAEDACAAAQGGIREITDKTKRFFWDSCGERFYFTSESKRWIEEHGGIGFSTINAAIRRDVWRAFPFGPTPILEDKKWQRQILNAGLEIFDRHDAVVEHTHDYDLRALLRRCASEGYGWKQLGERYTLGAMLKDLRHEETWEVRRRALIRDEVLTGSEKWFPILRPLSLWYGNRWARRVYH